MSATETEVLRHLVEEAHDFLADGHVEQAQRSADEARALAPDHPDVLCLCGELAWLSGDVERARTQLANAVELQPTHADAHHLLARIYEQLDDRERMIEHDLQVHRLDAAADRRAGLGSAADLDFIEREARRVLASLPPQFAERLGNVPVILEDRPHEDLVREGFDPRALGLFEGADDATGRMIGDLMAGGTALRPTRIVLFYANLLATCRSDAELADQVEITILHEIGHFFGLDEDQVAALGLE